jgi:hypothetical protein
MNATGGTMGTRALTDVISALLDAPARAASAFAGTLGQRATPGCEIPPPCWEPRPAGTCCLMLAPGSVATVRIHVSNCGWDRHIVGITALGKIAGWMKFEPTTMILGPQERAAFVVTLKVPDNIKPGLSLSGPILVRGCVDHFVRVDLTIAECAGVTCCDLAVRDCQDQIHHWYDHFYCPRPCRNPSIRDPKYG